MNYIAIFWNIYIIKDKFLELEDLQVEPGLALLCDLNDNLLFLLFQVGPPLNTVAINGRSGLESSVAVDARYDNH